MAYTPSRRELTPEERSEMSMSVMGRRGPMSGSRANALEQEPLYSRILSVYQRQASTPTYGSDRSPLRSSNLGAFRMPSPDAAPIRDTTSPTMYERGQNDLSFRLQGAFVAQDTNRKDFNNFSAARHSSEAAMDGYNKVWLKCICRNRIKTLVVNSQTLFEHVTSSLIEVFRLPYLPLYLTYEDEEGDDICIDSQEDFRLALRQHIARAPQSSKLIVHVHIVGDALGDGDDDRASRDRMGSDRERGRYDDEEEELVRQPLARSPRTSADSRPVSTAAPAATTPVAPLTPTAPLPGPFLPPPASWPPYTLGYPSYGYPQGPYMMPQSYGAPYGMGAPTMSAAAPGSGPASGPPLTSAPMMAAEERR